MVSGSGDLVLHHLVIKGRAGAEALAEATGLDAATIDAALSDLTSDGFVVEKTGRLPGFAPTPEGRTRAQQRVQVSELFRRRHELYDWYDTGFSVLNAELKDLCSAWQVLADGQTLNDHTDAEHDRRILVRMNGFHDRARDHLLAVRHPRMDRYASRLDGAIGAIRDGNIARFTAPLQDSYHDIWMELHQDLLMSLQRSRTAADA